MSLLGVLGLIFIVLKCVGVIAWSWWLVLLPWYIIPLIWGIILLAAAAGAATVDRRFRR